MSEFKFNLIGHDVELIARDKESNEPISCVEFVQENLGSCYVYPDNVLLEVNADPCELDEFAEVITEQKEDIESFLNDLNLYTTWGEAQAEYPKDQLCHPSAHRIGCHPFLNAYLLGVPLRPQEYTDHWRFAGGHIHLAYDKNLVPSHFLVKMLDDKFKHIDMEENTAKRRDMFYGQLGSFREKPYGLEYRSLTNGWMRNPQKIIDGLREIEAGVNAFIKDK